MSDRFRLGSTALLVVVLLLLPFIRDSVNEEVARFVSDSESSHVGLPTEWDENQVICIYFPREYPHPVYSSGVSMIDADGSIIGVNYDLNLTGACVGGFEGYTDGMNFMMDATRVAGGHLAVGYFLSLIHI